MLDPIGNPARPINQRLLLASVKNEVTVRLEELLHNTVMINLAKEFQPQQVKRIWDAEIQIGQKTSEVLPNITTIFEVFESREIAGKLLILGNPGSGKTTTQLELAQALVNKSEEQPDYPIPILLNLSSWQNERQSIIEWLLIELKSKYGISNKLGKQWLKERIIFPLLDGLDEVKATSQEICIQLINRFIQGEYRPHFLVICSRNEEYISSKTRLQLNGAIYLKTLTNSQILQYLNTVNKIYLWQAISNDSELLKLVKIPLMLNLIILSEKEVSTNKWQQFKIIKEPIKRLLEIYVYHRLRTHISSKSYIKKTQPDTKQIETWLIWLSQNMKGSEFLIEEIQRLYIPNINIVLFRTIVFSLIFGIVFGLFDGISFGILFGWFIEYTKTIRDKNPYSFTWLLTTVFGGILFGLIDIVYMLITGSLEADYIYAQFVISSLIYSLIIEASCNRYIGIEIVEKITFSWKDFKEKLFYGFFLLPVIFITLNNLQVFIMVFTLLISYLYKQGNSINFILNMNFVKAFLKNEKYFLLFGFICTLFFVPAPTWLIYGVIVGIVWGLISAFKGQSIEVKIFPNQGTWISAKNSLLMGIIYALVFGTIRGVHSLLNSRLNIWLFPDLIDEINSSLIKKCSSNSAFWELALKSGIDGLVENTWCSYQNIDATQIALIDAFHGMCFYGLVAWILGGGSTCIQHLITRSILYFQGHIPWNYARFLNYCTERMLLQRVGGRYRFIHKLLQDHFAQM